MHDKNGKALKVGDKVTVEFVIESTAATDDFCNVALKTVEPFHPDTTRFDTNWFNAKQTVLVE